MTKVLVRELNKNNEGEVRAVYGLFRQLTAKEVAFDNFKEWLFRILQGESQVYYVAEFESKIVGYLAAVQNYGLSEGKYVRLAGLVVDSSAKRQGIGSALVNKMESWAKENGASIIKLNSNVNRANEAHKFYMNKGYNKIKEQACFEKKLEN